MTSDLNGARRLAGRLALLAGLAAAPMLAACSSAAAHSSVPASSAIPAACAQVSAALSDGPDSGVDPVGYAEAQIRPLRAIKTQDPALRAAIRDLAAGYAAQFRSNGKSAAATRMVTAATRKVNTICQGVDS